MFNVNINRTFFDAIDFGFAVRALSNHDDFRKLNF